MISSIKKISKLGVFHNFQWNGSLDEFKKYNVVYGWNYSGKTTLSRAFTCLKNHTPPPHEDYKDVAVTVCMEGGNDCVMGDNTHQLPIHVFNEDFVKENIRWDEDMDPILILGEKNIPLQNELSKSREELKQIRENIKDSNITKRGASSSLQNMLSEKAREIKNTLSLPDYTRAKFEPLVKQCKNNSEKLLSDDKLKTHIDLYRSKNRRDDIPLVNIQTDEWSSLDAKIRGVLSTTVAGYIIARLQNNSELNEWVKQGRDLHTNETHCQFCESPLPSDLLDKLNSHFSDDYNEHTRLIDRLIVEVKSLSPNVALSDPSMLYGDLVEEYKERKTTVDDYIKQINQVINSVVEHLHSKKKNPFQAMVCDHTLHNISDSMVVKKLNEVIEKHNARSGKFEAEQEKTLKKLLEHYAVEFNNYAEYSRHQRLLKISEENLQAKSKKEIELTKTCANLEGKLSESVRGAARSGRKYNDG